MGMTPRPTAKASCSSKASQNSGNEKATKVKPLNQRVKRVPGWVAACTPKGMPMSSTSPSDTTFSSKVAGRAAATLANTGC